MEQMFIPKRIKIGFQARNDTFTGKLSYIIYFDEKGKLRKEASWNSWKDDAIDTLEFDNTPQPGYIFNKGVKRDGYWGSGRSVIRVYDPRDFEFEISVDNLMGILMHSDVSKRDIVEECVFAWAGKELVLLPTNSDEYRASVAYTQKQDQKITSKDLIAGYTYQAKKLDTPLVYIGYNEWFDWNNGYLVKDKISRTYNSSSLYAERHESKGKKHIFYNGTTFIVKTAADLSAILSEQVDENYSHLVEEFFKTAHSQKIVSLSTFNNKKKSSTKNNYYYITKESLFTIHVSYEQRYTNEQNLIRPHLTTSVKKLEYTGSLQFTSNNQYFSGVNELTKIIDEYHNKYQTHVPSNAYKALLEESREWLRENGIFEGYNIVLENGSEVIRSIYD